MVFLLCYKFCERSNVDMTVFRTNKNRDYTISIFWDMNSLTSEVKLETVTE